MNAVVMGNRLVNMDQVHWISYSPAGSGNPPSAASILWLYTWPVTPGTSVPPLEFHGLEADAFASYVAGLATNITPPGDTGPAPVWVAAPPPAEKGRSSPSSRP